MSRALYPYYERELTAIRQLAQEFAKTYPAAAGRLMLEPSRSTDPHVERLIEAFAFLTGRIQHKLDDEFPELTDALLNILYPHYLAPIPSCMTIEFEADPARTPLNNGYEIQKHTPVLTTPINDLRCRYRTVYPVTLWPVKLRNARLQAPPYQSLRLPENTRIPDGTSSILHLQLEAQAGARFSNISLDTLRLHLLGENQTSTELYELLLNSVIQVMLLSDSAETPAIMLEPKHAFTPVGFELGDGMLPYPKQSFPGYKLLTEMFAYPAKFWYVDLHGFDKAREAGCGTKLDVIVFLKRNNANLESAVDRSTFRIGCTPAINLFKKVVEPIPLTQAKTEYRIVPQVNQPSGMEVYSIDKVEGVDLEGEGNVTYRSFYEINHSTQANEREAFWYASRRPSTAESDRGSDMTLTLVDQQWEPFVPASSTLVITATCTNREYASHLQRHGDSLGLQLELSAPVQAIHCIRAPTLPLRPMRNRRGSYWQLVSHLSLNHLSIAPELSDEAEAKAALQEILRLYNFSASDSGSQLTEINNLLIDGITRLSSRRIVGRVEGALASGFCRGIEVTLELDEEKYVGTGAFLFASVLERFLALYVGLNSFTKLVARSKQGSRAIHAWPPRSGEKPLL